jgi:hypothetical protein
MKTYSKSELKKKAAEVFQQYPNAKQLHATVDGNIFLDINRAQLHSKDTIYTFDRPFEEAAPTIETPKTEAPKKDAGTKETKAPERISAEDAIKGIGEAKTLEALEPFAKDKRATVKAAYEAKLEALNAAPEKKESTEEVDSSKEDTAKAKDIEVKE